MKPCWWRASLNVLIYGLKTAYFSISLLLKEETCFCEKMWENRLDRKLHDRTWQNLFTQIKETKLIQLQWKILHNIYPTNILLHKIGIKLSERCDFCEEIDVVEHTFFRCERV